MINLKEHKKHDNKHLIAVLLASVLLSSLFVGVAVGFISSQSVYTNLADYVVLEGTAGSDYYDGRQYSYQVNQWASETVCNTYGSATTNPNPANWWFNANKSLRIGFTEFGEFATLHNTGIAVGNDAAEWANSESWASTGIPQKLWIQGWVFYMNYSYQTTWRQIEAYSVYSNLASIEAGRGVYSWDGLQGSVTGSPQEFKIPVTGNPLTIGTLTPSGVQVLYDSARLVVARASVTIHDGIWPATQGGYGDVDVAKITFTVIYNKDSKYAIVLKDVKILIPPKALDAISDIAFSERYEIDLAAKINTNNNAYVHWFHNYNQSVYMHPLTGETMTDVVQAYNPAGITVDNPTGKQYIFFAGYWPNCTQYSVYAPLVPNLPGGLTRVLPNSIQQADMPLEPNTPWIIAQWRYNNTLWPILLNFLANGPADKREIRFVEVFGMTDYNKPAASNSISAGAALAYNTLGYNATDFNETQKTEPNAVFGPKSNTLDVEVRYMLYGKVFVPEDLEDINDAPFQWIGLGQSAATSDSAGGLTLADLTQTTLTEPLGLFDRNDTLFPWTAPTIGNKGSIPYGLANGGNFNYGTAGYLEQFNNVAKGKGIDATPFYRTGLNGFAFGIYDDEQRSPPQPIAGGFSRTTNDYWYPSKDPLTERWATNFPNSNQPNAVYQNILYHPNGIITVGGEKANGLTRYFNDFNYAITREGITSYALADNNQVVGTAPTSNPQIGTFDYFPLTSWASSRSTFDYKNVDDASGYAVLAVARDINGTRGLSVYGWDARDTYWASAWASQYLGALAMPDWFPDGTVAIVLKISYTGGNAEPSAFTVVKALGTITEFGTNMFITDYAGFDIIPGAESRTWDGNVVPTPYPNYYQGYKVWWFAKLPTSSIAKVDYDP